MKVLISLCFVFVVSVVPVASQVPMHPPRVGVVPRVDAPARSAPESFVDRQSVAYGTVSSVGFLDGALVGELARPAAVSGARIDVAAEAAAAYALRMAIATGRGSVMTYGVSLLRDNSQNARANAYAAAARFSELHPGIEVQVSYDAPWFRVTAGLFVDRIDAVALCGRVIAAFPKAMVMQRELPVASVIAQGRSSLDSAE